MERIAKSVLPLPQDMLALGTCAFTGSELNNLFGVDSRGFIVDKLNPFLGHVYVVMNGEVAYLSARLPLLEAALTQGGARFQYSKVTKFQNFVR